MLVVDRLEGEYAVCEDSETGKIKRLAKVMLPRNVSEGDCLIKEADEYKIDAISTTARRKEMQNKLNKLYD